jgi:VWFA-related protein
VIAAAENGRASLEGWERMFINSRLDLFLLVLLLCAPQIPATQNHSAARPGDRVYLDVVVSPKSGLPVSGLQQQDFTILDNNMPQTITSFEAVDGRQAQVEVVLVIDAVNVEARELAIEREEIKRFLKTDKGRLAYPTTFAVLTETGIQLHLGSSRDGKAISNALDHSRIPARSTGRDTERGATAASFESSFEGFGQLVAEERERSGRKLIIWLSPRWPMLSDPQIFEQLREGQITLYMVDPSATADLEPGLELIPVNHTRPADTATQSGGLALHPGNDLSSAMRRCVNDARTYYEISFNPATADRPNEYHHLEIRVAKPGLTARTRQGYYSQPPRAENFRAGSEQPGKAGNDNNTPGAAPAEAGDAVYANAHPYLDWPLAQLTEHIPELQAIQPAPDQQELSMILQKMGRSVDDFVRAIGDLIAHEDVTQERLNAEGDIQAKERVQDNYLILHHGYEWGASAEYRMDEKGNRLGPVGLEKGYLVTSGHALSCISFSTIYQAQSKFRYLGEEKIESREAYVLGFAQKPGETTFFETMRGTGDTDVDMLTQGILWVDKNNFQIIRMRQDLLAPNNELQLNQLTTEVTFVGVQLRDVSSPLWLPGEVDVYIDIGKQKFRNVHHYTNYRRYRVAVKIGAPQ